jgi:hypothetical protein
MILKQIYLYPDLVEFNSRSEDVSVVRDQTRHICNYLERQLDSLKFDSGGFNKVCIVGYGNPSSEMYVASTKALAVPVAIDMDYCRSVSNDTLVSYYIELLTFGLKKASLEFNIPLGHFLQWLDDFKAVGYRNEWVFKDKKIRNLGIICRLNCVMTLEEFNLSLQVTNSSGVIYDRVILTTPPDEVAFHYRFKDVLVEGDNLVVVTKFDVGDDRILYMVSLSELLSS